MYRWKPWGQSELRMKGEKFRFISIYYILLVFVCIHTVSDISKTVSNLENCSVESHAIITTKGGAQLSVISRDETSYHAIVLGHPPNRDPWGTPNLSG